ncbi:hypothetical protein IAT38_000765 [Cryptococcus sp. DSM 104549]
MTNLPTPRGENAQHTHTPPVNGYRNASPEMFTSSPTMSHRMLNEEPIDYKDAAHSPEIVEKKKRKYSQRLYQWTQEMWENARQDIERRSSVSSNSTADSSEPSDSTTTAPNPAPAQNNKAKTPHGRQPSGDISGDVSAVPAYH